MWSADGKVTINGHHGQQANTSHAKEYVESCIDLETQKQRKRQVLKFLLNEKAVIMAPIQKIKARTTVPTCYNGTVIFGILLL